MKREVAECMVRDLSDELGEDQAVSVLEGDTDLSEQEGSEGVLVASAFTECNDDTFFQVYGYDPE